MARMLLILPVILAGSALIGAAPSIGASWWLSWFCLLPLFVAIRVLPIQPAFLCGAVWGGGYFLSASATGSVEVTTASAFLLLVLSSGTFAAFGAFITRRVGFSPLLLGLGWVGVEFALRPVGLHHGLLAGLQGESFLVQFLGSAAGYVVVAFVVAYVSAIVFTVLEEAYASAAGALRPWVHAAGALLFELIECQRFDWQTSLSPARPRGPPN